MTPQNSRVKSGTSSSTILQTLIQTSSPSLPRRCAQKRANPLYLQPWKEMLTYASLVTCARKDEFGFVPFLFRTYKLPDPVLTDSLARELKIWEVASATSKELRTPKRTPTASSDSSTESARLRKFMMRLSHGIPSSASTENEKVLSAKSRLGLESGSSTLVRDFDAKAVEGLLRLSQPGQGPHLPYYRFDVAESPPDRLEWDLEDDSSIGLLEWQVQQYLSNDKVSSRLREVAERLVAFRRIRMKRKKWESSRTASSSPSTLLRAQGKVGSDSGRSEAADSAFGRLPTTLSSQNPTRVSAGPPYTTLHVRSAFLPESWFSSIPPLKLPWWPKDLLDVSDIHGSSLHSTENNITVMAALVTGPPPTSATNPSMESPKECFTNASCLRVRADSIRTINPGSTHSKPSRCQDRAIDSPVLQASNFHPNQRQFSHANGHPVPAVNSRPQSPSSKANSSRKGFVAWIEEDLGIQIRKDQSKQWILIYCIKATTPKRLHCKRRYQLPESGMPSSFPFTRRS